MRTRYASSRSGLFLIELIIAIVFFAVASAICIQLFVQAHLISTRSRDLTVAMNLAQNHAEHFRALSPAERSDRYEDEGAAITDHYYRLEPDGNLTFLGAEHDEEATFCVTSRYPADSLPLKELEIAVAKLPGDPQAERQSLYNLTVACYDGEEAAPLE